MSTVIKIIKTLHDKKGVSLLMVLAAMMFLVIISVSTLIAALGATSVIQTQKDKTQIDLFAESVQMTLHSMLNAADTSQPTEVSLQTFILTNFYNHKTFASELYDEMNFSFEFTDWMTSLNPKYNYTFKSSIDTSDLLLVSTNNIVGTVYITVDVDLDATVDDPAAQGLFRYGYRLTNTAVVNDSGGGDATDLTIDGTWELVQYERLERQNPPSTP